jgi:hypothetical protein
MNLTDLRNQIETIAWGPRGTEGLQAATAHASPVMVICAAFQDMRERTDLTLFETETLRECCKMIRAHQFHGLAQEALEVQVSLPPSPQAFKIAGVDPNE